MIIDKLIGKFFECEKEHMIITDTNGDLVWKSEFFPYSFDQIFRDIRAHHEDVEEWELVDAEQRVSLKARRMRTEYEGKEYICFHFTDVTEFSLLTKEALSYTKSLAEISAFQTQIVQLMSDKYDSFMPALAQYCGAKELMMYCDTDGYITKSVFSGTMTRTRLENTSETEDVFSCHRNEKRGGYLCMLSSSTDNRRYCVFAKLTPSFKPDNFLDISAYNVLKLFIENSILRERIVYESEHDGLTGLYNKGKYIALKAAAFGRPESIAIFNLDVNNLKNINDSYGHERGDELIINAAKSIHRVVSDKVYGFRMGGDEFLIVAVDISEKEALRIRRRWEQALDEQNRSGNIQCVIACGMQFGEGDYDYDELYRKADELMYLDKKARKEKGQTSHLKQ